ncbi:MAG: hypothetical protein JSV53_04630 [candidate division WOR-3 bacterium]|nr:MAG: hypothetical protein JSV53_04630 [candidate division WOR-3 bacterium]
MLSNILFVYALLGTDFPICTVNDFQDYAEVEYVEDLFYVFWIDRRFYFVNEKFAIFGARVGMDGHVIDPNGKLVFCDSTADGLDVASDMNNLFIVSRNHC